MRTELFDPKAPKKPINLGVNSDLLRQAKALGINLSQVLEQRLVEMVREVLDQQWLRENRAALEAYNHRIERDGVFSEGLRRF